MHVKILCLGVLSFGEASGYEIKKSVEDGAFSHFIDASFGSIYPALNQLALEGFLTVEEREQRGRPDKKVYAITETGRRHLARALHGASAKDKYKSEFLFQMRFLDILPVELAVGAVEKQLIDLKSEMKTITGIIGQDCSLGAQFVAGYGRAGLMATIAYLEGELAQLTQRLSSSAAE